jgi:hypothetical protein
MNPLRRASAAALVGIALAACSTSTPSTAEQTFCDAEARFEDSLGAFQALDPETASIDDYRAGWTQVRADFREMLTYREELAETNIVELNAAVEDLLRAFDALGNDVPIQEAIDSLQEERQAVRTAWAAIDDDLSCPQ